MDPISSALLMTLGQGLISNFLGGNAPQGPTAAELERVRKQEEAKKTAMIVGVGMVAAAGLLAILLSRK